MRIAFALLALGFALPLSAADQPLLYERVATHLASRPDLADLGAPPKELAEMDWMLGRWSIEAVVEGRDARPADHGTAEITRVNGGVWIQMADTYPSGNQDLGFLTYNRVTQRWIAIGLDTTGNAVTTYASAWENGRLTFTAPAVEIVGEKVVLRQIFEKLSGDEFLITNEEQTPDAAWQTLDRYRYKRNRET